MFRKPMYNVHKLIEFDRFHETRIPVEFSSFVTGVPATGHDHYWNIRKWTRS